MAHLVNTEFFLDEEGKPVKGGIYLKYDGEEMPDDAAVGSRVITEDGRIYVKGPSGWSGGEVSV